MQCYYIHRHQRQRLQQTTVWRSISHRRRHPAGPSRHGSIAVIRVRLSGFWRREADVVMLDSTRPDWVEAIGNLSLKTTFYSIYIYEYMTGTECMTRGSESCQRVSEVKFRASGGTVGPGCFFFVDHVVASLSSLNPATYLAPCHNFVVASFISLVVVLLGCVLGCPAGP